METDQLRQFYKPEDTPGKETELAKTVVTWLQEQNWDVYQEVQFSRSGGVADIVAVRHGILWIIECKMSYGFAVLQQASRWVAHYRSVAVPLSKSKGRDYRVARLYYRVGVLEVSQWGVHEKEMAPQMYRKNKLIAMYKSELTELHKTFAPAGSQSGHHLTPYKQTMMQVRRFIERNQGCTVKVLYEHLGFMHYASKRSFTGNLVKALEAFESWCRIDKSAKPYRLYTTDFAGE